MKNNNKIQKLEFIIGKWNTSGIIRATDKFPEVKIKGTDTYEWVSNKAFILHTVDVMMGDEHIQSIEVIGFDEKLQNYPMHSFDHNGVASFMTGNFDDKNAFLLSGEKMRATLTVNVALSAMKAFWELSEDGITWTPWMDITFSK